MNTSPPTRSLSGLVARILVCGAFVALAALAWTASRAERQVARFDEALATLQYDTPARELADLESSTKYARSIPWFTRLVDGARGQRASGDYWQSRAGDGSGQPADPLITANVAFRTTQNAPDRLTMLKQLEAVQKQYADVLKTTPARLDAAYNYEYVARLRGRLTKARDTRAAASPGPASIHGREGAPPEDVQTRQFKMFVPMQPDERKNVQPDAGKGEKKPRKG